MACHDLGYGTRTSTRDANTEKFTCACKTERHSQYDKTIDKTVLSYKICITTNEVKYRDFRVRTSRPHSLGYIVFAVFASDHTAGYIAAHLPLFEGTDAKHVLQPHGDASARGHAPQWRRDRQEAGTSGRAVRFHLQGIDKPHVSHTVTPSP